MGLVIDIEERIDDVPAQKLTVGCIGPHFQTSCEEGDDHGNLRELVHEFQRLLDRLQLTMAMI